MLRVHSERGAAVTLAAIEVPIADASRFGIVAIDEDEPRHRLPGEAGRARSRSLDRPTIASASMGIYIFDTDVLVRALEARRQRADRATTSARTSSRR